MSMLADDSAVMTKVRELCAAIAEDDRFQSLQGDVEKFMDDEQATLMYRGVHERGSELHQKQHAGVELSDSEIREFESARDQLMANPVARGFMDAQGELETLQRSVMKYVNMTMELGHVPSTEEIAAAEGGGCCGGGGGGCGCSH
ncbi:YlbF family regulator [Haloferula sargassicola]